MQLAAVATAAEEKVTFDDQVFPIFQQACLNCHNPDKAKGGLDLSTFTAAMKGGSGGKIVEPGDVGCVLVGSVMQTTEKKMPPEGDKLAAAQIETIKKWIEGGLLENKTSSARKASKPKFESALRSDPAAKPEGPPPMPVDVLLEPPVVTPRAAAVHAICASPWAPLLAVTGQRQVLLVSTETLELAGVLPFPEGDPVSLAFTPEGRYLIVGGGVPGKTGVTVTFDVTNGSRLLSAGKEFDSVLAADIRPGFDLVATGGPSRLLKIWNTTTGELVKSIKKHTDWITALDLSNDGVLLASGDRNGGVWVWESESGNEYQTLRGHQAGITALGFRADSNLLGTASEDGTVRFWEMNGGSEVKKIDAHGGGVTAFAFGKDGSSVTAGRDMKAKLWKADFNAARELAKDLPALPTAVALDWEGKRAFVADALGVVRVYETADGKPAGEIPANPPTIGARLDSLAEATTACESALAEADKAMQGKTSAREAAKQGLAEAEKRYQQAVEILKAAQAGAEVLKDGVKDEAAVKIAAEAQGRIEPAEKEVAAKRAELEGAEKAAAEAMAACGPKKAELANLQGGVKRWSAAAINTKALAARQAVEESAVALDGSRVDFTVSAGTVAERAAALNAKRAERENFAAGMTKEGLAPEIAEEMRATLAALDISIGREAEALRQAEDGALALRESIETAAPVAFQKAEEAESLRLAYRKALE